MTDGGAHLILEFLPKHLKGLIESFKDSVPYELTHVIGMQVLRALEFMHQREVSQSVGQDNATGSTLSFLGGGGAQAGGGKGGARGG